jgi:uncharacterized protein
VPRMIFPNLAVADVERAKQFFSALGFSFNPQFTDHNAACMVVNELACVMLLKAEFFRTFTMRTLVDTRTHLESLIAIELESRDAVDAMVTTALANGGQPAMPPQDHGFMYQHSFLDPDGHQWEPFYMDPSHVQPVS